MDITGRLNWAISGAGSRGRWERKREKLGAKMPGASQKTKRLYSQNGWIIQGREIGERDLGWRIRVGGGVCQLGGYCNK